ncbi:hypothetical protein [Vulcanococcus sp.]|uniref:hypothetical protein n=1 Tax=Vulcanococcus sp. TaxID=2856995 RepID=UPI0037D9DA97
MSDTPSLEADLRSLERFRDWLQSLVAAQQPLDEWAMSVEELRERWLPKLRERPATTSSRLYF